MKSKYLFPAWCSLVGYVLAIPGLVLGYLCTIENYEIPGFGLKMRNQDGFFQKSFENFTNELAIFLVIIGLVLIAFSRSKKEDELNAKVRLNSLYWSVMIYYIVYLIAMIINISIMEIPFVANHILEINLVTPLIIFILRYHYLIYVNKDQYLIANPKFLAHQPFKLIGIIMSVIGFCGVFYFVIKDSLDFDKSALEFIVYCSLVFGLLLWSFSKQKVEDEMTMQLRLENLQLAVYFNYILILVATIFVYSLSYLMILMFAQFSILLFFIIRMEYINYKNNQVLTVAEGELNHEK